MGGRQEEREERSAGSLSGSVCALGMFVQLRAETCQIPGSNFTRIVLPQEMHL